MAAELNLENEHLDVETVYLNGTFDETVYMTQPDGFVNVGEGNKFVFCRSLLMDSSRLVVVGTKQFKNSCMILGMLNQSMNPASILNSRN
jgi:hypothetical protein